MTRLIEKWGSRQARSLWERPTTIQQVADEIASEMKREQEARDGKGVDKLMPILRVVVPRYQVGNPTGPSCSPGAHYLTVEVIGESIYQKYDGPTLPAMPSMEAVETFEGKCRHCGVTYRWTTAEPL